MKYAVQLYQVRPPSNKMSDSCMLGKVTLVWIFTFTWLRDISKSLHVTPVQGKKNFNTLSHDINCLLKNKMSKNNDKWITSTSYEQT